MVRQKKKAEFLTEVELEFMTELWALGRGSVRDVLARLAEHDVLGGLDLGVDHPELGNALLVCATETKTDEDIERYRALLADVMNEQGSLASAG